jgi:DedD protein
MTQTITTDEAAQLKRQARRRLIGAVALLTAAVVILPMVLDKEPAPLTQNIELTLPDANKVTPFAPALVAASAVLTSSSAAPAAVAASLPAPVVAPAPPALAAQKMPAENKPEAAPIKAVHKPVPPPVVAKVKPIAEHDPVKTAPLAQPKHGFTVQVGAFANADTVHHLLDKLTQQGLHPYTEKIGGTIRVRVGNYPTHEAAEKARHHLETTGVHPAVVSLD